MFNPDDARNNHLLANLPAHEFDHLRPALKRVLLTNGQVLHRSGDRFEYVYFPTTALIALLYLTESGSAVGVGMIGSEGIVGIEVFMGVDSAPGLAIVQNAGIAFRMGIGAFRAECTAVPVCHDTLLKYAQALIAQVSQTAACNRFHTVQQRLARLLLESSDRLGSNRIAATHDQMSGPLGVRRESVSIAAHNLSVVGLIKVERGMFTIVDRPGLEFAACECYKVASAEYRRLLEPVISRPVGETVKSRLETHPSHY